MKPSVTNTLQNGTLINGVKIDENFTDVINAESDGTKDLYVANLVSTSLLVSNSLLTNSLEATTSLSSGAAVLTILEAPELTTPVFGFTEKQSIKIDTSSTITPSSSCIEIDSQIYQYALFAAGIDILAGINDAIDFIEDIAEITVYVSAGTYIPTALATEIETQLNAVGTNLYACVYNSTTQKFTITSDHIFTVLWRTGTNWRTNCGKSIGVDVVNDKTAITITSDYPYQIEYTDELATIATTNFSSGAVLTLKKIVASTSKILTIKNGTGNINCASDRELTDASTVVLALIGTSWNLLSFSTN
jgi:hypothetical protein